MNKAETIKLIQILEGFFPNAFKDFDKERYLKMVEAWALMFESEEPAQVEQAVKNLAKTMRFCPSISEVCEELNRIKSTARVKKDMYNADIRGTTLQMLETIYGKGNAPDDVLEMEVKEREAFYREIAK